MAIHFDGTLNASVANGAVCAFLGLDDSPARAALVAAGGRGGMAGVTVHAPPVAAPAECWESTDAAKIRAAVHAALEQSPQAVVLGPSFWLTDEAFREAVFHRLHALARAGATVLFHGGNLDAVRRHADEALVFSAEGVVLQAETGEALARFGQICAESAHAHIVPAAPQPASRHGDGRAKLKELAVLNAEGHPAAAVSSGAELRVRISFAYSVAVADPVVGLLIRNRIGISTYGTNTELEAVPLGPVEAGGTRTVEFSFRCALCPGLYTLTAASHDPDGTAHDWMDEAVLLTVTDTRYTEGVANLRAEVRRVED